MFLAEIPFAMYYAPAKKKFRLAWNHYLLERIDSPLATRYHTSTPSAFVATEKAETHAPRVSSLG
jgi:hypothetical protein